MSGVKTYLRFILATLVAVSCTAPAVAAGREKPEKVDKALAGALKSGAGTHKVIITLQPGQRSSVRKSLEAKGRRIKREHSKLNLLVADLTTADVMEWVKSKKVKALSLDGPVYVSQLLDPSVTPLSTTVDRGAPITFTTANAAGYAGDWVGLYNTNAPDGNYLAWQFLNGATDRRRLPCRPRCCTLPPRTLRGPTTSACLPTMVGASRWRRAAPLLSFPRPHPA